MQAAAKQEARKRRGSSRRGCDKEDEDEEELAADNQVLRHSFCNRVCNRVCECKASARTRGRSRCIPHLRKHWFEREPANAQSFSRKGEKEGERRSRWPRKRWRHTFFFSSLKPISVAGTAHRHSSTARGRRARLHHTHTRTVHKTAFAHTLLAPVIHSTHTHRALQRRCTPTTTPTTTTDTNLATSLRAYDATWLRRKKKSLQKEVFFHLSSRS